MSRGMPPRKQGKVTSKPYRKNNMRSNMVMACGKKYQTVRGAECGVAAVTSRGKVCGTAGGTE